jgi:hypothetical protein
MSKIEYVIPVLLLVVATIGQIKSVKACGLDDIGSCFSETTDAYAAGQQDAQYDHQQGLQYNPTPLCCHSDEWSNQFRQGYDTQWNQYQSQTANVNVENSPGAVVNVGQTSNQNQGPSETPVGYSDQCGCSGPCGGPCDNSYGGLGCDFGCSDGPYFHFHHFGCGFNCGGYRHGEDPDPPS